MWGPARRQAGRRADQLFFVCAIFFENLTPRDGQYTKLLFPIVLPALEQIRTAVLK